jgi:ribosome-associated translation inhibitor RaiA
MNIEVRLEGSDEQLRTYVERRLLSQVGDLERALTRVTVCLSLLPGRDYRCRMVTQPWAWGRVAVEENHSDPYAAIDRASSRLERTVRVVMRGTPVRGPRRVSTAPEQRGPLAG